MKNSLLLFYVFYFLVISLNIINCAIHTKDEWKSRTIYQLVTDRFAKTKESDPTKCALFNETCGGTFKGINESFRLYSRNGL